MIGNSASTANSSYVNNNRLQITENETVYYVVNSENFGNSQYWSNTNVNSPQLLWEL